MLVSLPPYGLFVAFAGTKHCCLTAINRCGALYCPDFPRDRGLKQMFFFPYPAIDRHTIFISLTSVIFYGVLLLKLASNSFYLPRASWARGKRRKRCRPKDADKRRSCDKRIYSLLLIRFPLLKLASNSFYLPRASWARGKRRKRCRPKDAASVVHATSAFRRRAAYGNRTRLLGLGSRCTTDVLMPQFRCKITTFFSYMQKKRQNTCFSRNEHVYILLFFPRARARLCI